MIAYLLSQAQAQNDNFFTIAKMHIIAERLKELREARHLSQRAFAQQLGVPQPSYSRYETSDDERFVFPGSNIVIRICKLFDCRAGWLLGLEGAESAPAPSVNAGSLSSKGAGSPNIIATGSVTLNINGAPISPKDERKRAKEIRKTVGRK